MADPRIHSTADWGAAPPLVAQFAREPAEGIVVHNTEGRNRLALGDPDAELAAAYRAARRIQQDHFARGWSDTGQHFTISQGGVIMEGRHGTLEAARSGEVVQASHCPGKNTTWWGVELCGDNREAFVVTEPQWAALVDLCVWLSTRAGADLAIEPHNRFRDTTCPGKIAERIETLKQEVQARLG